jgi:hypothetical protein
MIEYFATSVSYPAASRNWRSLLSLVVDHLRAHHQLAALPQHLRWLWVDGVAHKILSAKWLDPNPHWLDSIQEISVPMSSAQELWLSIDFPVPLGQRTYSVDVRVRVSNDVHACVELWFPTYVYMDVYERDAAMDKFDSEHKAALIRFMLGMSKLLGAEEFGYREADEDSVFGEPDRGAILAQLDADTVWSMPKKEYIVAGMLTSKVPPGTFEPDDGDPPWHYELNGYALYDRLWPISPKP